MKKNLILKNLTLSHGFKKPKQNTTPVHLRTELLSFLRWFNPPVTGSSSPPCNNQPHSCEPPPANVSVSPHGGPSGDSSTGLNIVFFLQVLTFWEIPRGTWSWETLERANGSRPSACLGLESSLSLAPPTGWAQKSSMGRDMAGKLMCGEEKIRCREAQMGIDMSTSKLYGKKGSALRLD